MAEGLGCNTRSLKSSIMLVFNAIHFKFQLKKKPSRYNVKNVGDLLLQIKKVVKSELAVLEISSSKIFFFYGKQFFTLPVH